MPEERWQRKDGWIGTHIEDSLVMVSVEVGKYVALNATADAIWQALEVPRSEREICDILQAQFSVPADTCAIAVTKALAHMRDLDIAAPC